MNLSEFQIFLTDNGSLRPESTFELRRIAAALTARIGQGVRPVSLLHAHKIEPGALGGEPATIVKRALRRGYADGQRYFMILPLFLGPSRALSEYLPEVIASLSGECPEMEVRIADPLAGPDVSAPDPLLVEMCAAAIERCIATEGLDQPLCALCDHGTPELRVNQVREAVVERLAVHLGDTVAALTGCCMERRDGRAYDFNNPMLEQLNTLAGFERGDLVVAMFFLLPGRHAGADGDVASICDALRCGREGGRIVQTGLLAEDARLIDLLERRLSACVDC